MRGLLSLRGAHTQSGSGCTQSCAGLCSELQEEEQGSEGLEDDGKAAALPPTIRACIPERFCSAEISSEGGLPALHAPAAFAMQSKLWAPVEALLHNVPAPMPPC